MPKIGVDLGGTKTEILLLDDADQPLWRHRVATPATDYEAILDQIAGLVADAERRVQQSGLRVGIGIPGAISPNTGLLRNSNTVCMNGKPFRADLETRLQREVRIENDANCFTLSEARLGAGRGYGLVFGVIVGTGTGGGLVIDGRLRRGPHAICGEWGHNPLPWTGAEDIAADCYCGKQGCIETHLSGPGMAQTFRVRCGRELESDAIVAAAASGDPDCAAMLALYHSQMARAFAQVINLLDPDVIVLGGGMSNIESIYTEVPAILPRYVFSDFVHTPLLAAEQGDSSGVFGAAMLWD